MRNLLLILTTVILASCAGPHKASKMVTNIRTDLKRNYDIKDGEIVAKFDLAGLSKKNSLFAPYYGEIINHNKKNEQFLTAFSKAYRSNKNHLYESAADKFHRLNTHLLELHKKYKILPSSLVHNLQKYAPGKTQKSVNTVGKSHYLALLASLHNHTKLLPLYLPVENAKITSRFGNRIHPKTKKQKFHNGLDLVGRKSCAIYAAGDGVVELVGRSHSYGNMVIISHNNHIKTRYAHLNKIVAKQGERLLLGQLIGSQGCSGTTTGEHLHLEVIINNKVVDPLDFIKPNIN